MHSPKIIGDGSGSCGRSRRKIRVKRGYSGLVEQPMEALETFDLFGSSGGLDFPLLGMGSCG